MPEVDLFPILITCLWLKPAMVIQRCPASVGLSLHEIHASIRGTIMADAGKSIICALALIDRACFGTRRERASNLI